MSRLAVVLLALFSLFCLGGHPLPARDDAAEQKKQTVPKETSKHKPTDAERIVRLLNQIDDQKKELKSIKDKLENPENDYVKAQQHFQKLDRKLSELQEALQKSKKAGKTKEAAALAKQIEMLRKDWDNARETFNLRIKEWKILREKSATIAKELKQAQNELAVLQGRTPPESKTAEPKKKEPTPPEAKPKQQPATKDKKDGKSKTPAPAAGSKKKPESKELAKAQKEAQQTTEEAKKTEDKAKALEERLKLVNKQIGLEEKLLQTARDEADSANAARNKLAEEVQTKQAAGASDKEIQPLLDKLEKAKQRAAEARKKVRSSTDDLTKLQQQRSALLKEKLAVVKEAQQKQREAQKAKSKVAELENPFTLRNILEWTMLHGPKLLIILVAMFILHRAVLLLSARIVKIVVRRNKAHGNAETAEARANTLVSVFRSAADIAILIGGSLMLLDEVGIPILPLLGTAGIVGLAFAFGAQNLIRDYFTGFMILLEDQYSVNDVVQIGDIGGQVEKITLRVTTLRDLSGVAHFVPHGTIKTVSNMTHGWSRAYLEIGVAYKEDVDQVMAVLMELGREMRKDPEFGKYILDDPEMLGVDEFGNSSVIIKFFIKTRPLRQWPVRRELMRRIKKRFDELGIEIPFPQRVIYQRTENGQSPLQAEETKRENVR